MVASQEAGTETNDIHDRPNLPPAEARKTASYKSLQMACCKNILAGGFVGRQQESGNAQHLNAQAIGP